MDWIIADLPVAVSGYNAFMVMVDKLTKYVHIVPTTKDSFSEDVTRLFIANVFQYHGLPNVLISTDSPLDSGKHSVSNLACNLDTLRVSIRKLMVSLESCLTALH